MSTPSRLYRRANPARLNMFSIVTEDMGTLTDADVASLTITRGADSPMPSLAPSVAEFTIKGAAWPETNTNVDVRLGLDYAATLTADPSAIVPRVRGRLGAYTTDDHGTRFTTTLQTVHWSSLARNARRTVAPTHGQQVSDLLVRALDHPDLNTRYTPVNTGSDSGDTISGTHPYRPAREIFDQYGAGTGTLLREKRNGNVEVVALTRRRFEIERDAAVQLPIMRRNGIAPAQWRQDIEAANTQFKMTRRTKDDTGLEVMTYPLPFGYNPTLTEVEDLDWSTIRPNTDNYQFYVNARNYAANLPENRLRSITLDLSWLLSSPVTYDRRLALQALRYEVGDLVMLARDWPTAVAGRYSAQQITERITPHGWEMELALQPVSRVAGYNIDESRLVPAYTWDQLTAPWDSTTPTWDSYALPPA